jgi:hypothetical protein
MRFIKKSRYLLVLIFNAYLPSSIAVDFNKGSLGESVGASDLYRLVCSGSAGDYDVDFKVIDNSASFLNDIPPQNLNVRILKGATEIGRLKAESSSVDEILIPAVNGSYSLLVDTLGGNSFLNNPQIFTFDYQCRNSGGKETRSSGFTKGQVKKIVDGKVLKYTLQCNDNKSISPSSTQYLYVKIINQTELRIKDWVGHLPILTSQVTSSQMSLNTSDLAGDSLYSNKVNVKSNDGLYYISVNNSAVSDGFVNAKKYSFSYSCAGVAGENVQGVLSVVQDQ